MIGFLIGVAALCLLAAGLLLARKPGAPRAADASDPNLGWYTQRQAELEGQDAQLLDDARLRLLEDSNNEPAGPIASPVAGRGLGLVLLVLVLLVSAGLYLQTGSIEDVLIYEELAQLTPEDSEATRTALLDRIAARSRVKEDNLQYLGLLGQLYMAGEDYASASRSFGRLAEKAPEDPQALAMAAQARFLAADRQLDEQAQLLAERALAVDPTQRTALGLLGMASFENGAYSAAVNYWGRLQEQEAPGSPGYDMLEQVIAVAMERGGLSSELAAAPQVDDDVRGISVSLALPEGHQVDPEAVVFVFARRAEAQGGMPIAVRRLQAAQLPLTLRLSDGDSMAGQLLSEAGAVLVSAQLSANGQPGAANASLSGVGGPVSAGGSEVAVQIQLQGRDQRG
ncbi:c-type cytochrome biogenesis protein CcmI [Congregibacter variabilis]|uniref:C-type cytochrome biogenesis protein CcmI n=1 Tax=Congregibacter variabilis TaxID=3081200 RepID=A0ABZ0I3A4_9GAMM|nr:c-type cytochrome biogenesis protein CcmI [Congregibacter sp. IMCC43200]